MSHDSSSKFATVSRIGHMPVSRAARGRGFFCYPLAHGITIVLILALCCTSGCKRQQPKAEFPEQLDIEDYGRLPGLKGSSLEKLQNELARIEHQQGTPEMLDGIGVIAAEESSGSQPPSGQAQSGQIPSKRLGIPNDVNVAAGLAEAFDKKTLSALQDAADKQYPRGRFEFNALQLRMAVGFLSRHQDELLKARQALGRPQCDFGIQHIRGFGNDVSFIERVRLAGRLEALAVAKSLFTEDNPSEAIDALQNMLHWAKLLGDERHAASRLQAGMLRAEALEVLQAIALHPRCKKKDLERLHEILHKHLAEWPSDAEAWIGDRALGMHCYEIVRDGAIVGLLTPEEVEEFSDIGSLEDLPAAAKEIADEDELFYLYAMRKIIEGCQQPYYQRASMADDILAEAAAKGIAADYPLVADRLLLPDINRGLRMQAEDRAATESWAVGIEAALGRPTSYTVNPLSGKKYLISRGKKQVSVLEPNGQDETPKPKVVVPLR